MTLQENALRNNDKEAAQAAVARRAGRLRRKLQELKYAVTLEKELTKDQILQGYLNLVYYGDQAYGVEAAAQHYFSVSAAELTLPQAALLAGPGPAPRHDRPGALPRGAPWPAATSSWTGCTSCGSITDKQWTTAKGQPRSHAQA